MFRKIITATDLIDTKDPAVLTAFRLAEINDGNFHLLHVLESASPDRHIVRHYQTGQEIEDTTEYENEVRAVICNTYRDMFGAGNGIDVRVTTGYPSDEILRFANDIQAELIVLGPHSGRAEEKGVVRIKGKVGSTSEAVIMDEHCPVMIVNQRYNPAALSFDKLLVGIDFSASCICALGSAMKIAARYGSKLYLFHMLPVPPGSQYTHTLYEHDVIKRKENLAALCSEIPDQIVYEYEVRGGVLPHLEIVDYARKNDINMIVMGSHTKIKNGKWYVGSAVERTSYRADCPVVVITDPEVATKIEI